MKSVFLAFTLIASTSAFAASIEMTCYRNAKAILAQDGFDPENAALLLCNKATSANGPIDCYKEARQALPHDGVDISAAIFLCGGNTYNGERKVVTQPLELPQQKGCQK